MISDQSFYGAKSRPLTNEEQNEVAGGVPALAIIGGGALIGGVANTIDGFGPHSTWSSVGRDFVAGAIGGAIGGVGAQVLGVGAVGITASQYVIRLGAATVGAELAIFQINRAFEIAGTFGNGGGAGPENNGRDKRADKGQPEEEPQ